MKVDEVRTRTPRRVESRLEVEKEELASKLDEYLSYVVENWMKRIKLPLTLVFVPVSPVFHGWIEGLFEKLRHHAEESYDLVEGLNDKVDDLEDVDDKSKSLLNFPRDFIKANARLCTNHMPAT